MSVPVSFVFADSDPIADLLQALQEPAPAVVVASSSRTASVVTTSSSGIPSQSTPAASFVSLLIPASDQAPAIPSPIGINPDTNASASSTADLLAVIAHLQDILRTLVSRAAKKATVAATTTQETASSSLALPVEDSTPKSTSACVDLTQTIARGSKGNEVEQLQLFLIEVGLLSPDSGTGYFGAATEHALQQWQEAHDIVSSGDARSTGFGATGVNTREAMRCKLGTKIIMPDFSAASTSSTTPDMTTASTTVGAPQTTDPSDETDDNSPAQG